MPILTLSRRQALLVVACVIAAVVLVSRLFAAPGSTPRPAAAPLTAAPRTSPPPRGRIVVDVAGAVRRPGVYRLSASARVADAVARAGGAARRADTAGINLAAPLVDGQQVLVPLRVSAAGAAGATPSSSSPSPAQPLSLNVATSEQLEALPGIGPVTAQRIIEYRDEHGPFASVDELDAVSGIGPARLESLRGLVVP